MANYPVSVDQKVLVIWNKGVDPEKLKSVHAELSNLVGSNGHVQLENIDRLEFGKCTIVWKLELNYWCIAIVILLILY